MQKFGTKCLLLGSLLAMFGCVPSGKVIVRPPMEGKLPPLPPLPTRLNLEQQLSDEFLESAPTATPPTPPATAR